MTIEPIQEFIPQMTTGDRLRRIRRDVKLSQREFAAELGVKESTYNAWETGRNAVADEVAVAKRVQLRWKVPAWWTLGLEMPTTPAGPEGPNGGRGDAVRHQGLEPRTRWYVENPRTEELWGEVVPLFVPTPDYGDESVAA